MRKSDLRKFDLIYRKLDRKSAFIDPLSPNSDINEISHRNIKGLSVSEVMRRRKG